MGIGHDIKIGLRVLFINEHKHLKPTKIYNEMKKVGLGMRKQNFFRLFKNLFPHLNENEQENNIDKNKLLHVGLLVKDEHHKFIHDIKNFMSKNWKMSGRNFEVYFFVVLKSDETYTKLFKTEEFLSYGMRNIYDFNRIMGNIEPNNIVQNKSCFFTSEGKLVTENEVKTYFRIGEWI